MFFEEDVHYNPEELSKLSLAPLKGLYHAGEHLLETIRHPIDGFIIPVATLVRDGSVFIATAAAYDDMLTQARFVSVKDYLDAQPQIFHDACKNMTLRAEAIKEGSAAFSESTVPQKIEQISENVFGMILSGGAVKFAKQAGKSGINYYKFKRNLTQGEVLTAAEITAGIAIAETVTIEGQNAFPTLNASQIKKAIRTAIGKPTQFVAHVVEDKFLHADTSPRPVLSTSPKITMADISKIPAVQEYVRLMNQDGVQFSVKSQQEQTDFSTRVGSAALNALLHPPMGSPLHRLNDELCLNGYITTAHGPFLNAGAKSHLKTRHQAMGNDLTQFMPVNDQERGVHDILKSKHAHLSTLLQGLEPKKDNMSLPLQEILQTSKTTEELAKSALSRLDELQRTGTETDKQILSYVQEIAEHQKAEALHNQFFRMKNAERERSLEMSQKLDGTGQCAMALAGFANAVGNKRLAKPLTMVGASCQGLAASAAFSAATGPAALFPLAGMIGAAATLLSTFFSDDDDDDALGEYLQHIAEQIGLLRQEVFELKQFMATFREELYDRLNIQFGEVHHQLFYISEVMCNTSKRSDYKSDRILQGIEAILSQQQQNILCQALSYGRQIPIDMLQNEAMMLLPQVAQLIDTASMSYFNGGQLSQQESLLVADDIQKMLTGDLVQRGPLFGYIANVYPEHLRQPLPMINPAFWTEAVRAYISARKTPIAQNAYDREQLELARIIEQGQAFISFTDKLRQGMPHFATTLLESLKNSITSTVKILEYSTIMQQMVNVPHVMPQRILNTDRSVDFTPETIFYGAYGVEQRWCDARVRALYDNEYSRALRGLHRTDLLVPLQQHLKDNPYSIPKIFLALDSAQYGRLDFYTEVVEYTVGRARVLLNFRYGTDNTHLISQYGVNWGISCCPVLSEGYTFQQLTYIKTQFNPTDVQKAEKILQDMRNKETGERLTRMNQWLPGFRAKFINDMMLLQIIVNLVGLPKDAMKNCPSFNFPKELSTWTQAYQVDLQRHAPLNPLPLSQDVIPALKNYLLQLQGFAPQLMAQITKYLASPYSPELSQVHSSLSRLYALQTTLSSAQSHRSIQFQLAEDQKASVLALKENQEQLKSRVLGLQQLIQRLRPLAQTNRLSNNDLTLFLQATRQVRIKLGLDAEMGGAFEPTSTVSQSFLRQHWEEEINALPFNETQILLKQVARHFEVFPRDINQGVVFVGRTGVGKSTLINRFLGVEYTKVIEEGEIFAKAVHGKEFSKTSQSSVSETLLPYAYALNDYHLIDMPGFDDSRGKPTEISNGVGMMWLTQYVPNLKGMVIVCDSDDLKLKSKFTVLRRSLEAVGHIIQNNPAQIEQQLCFVVTRSTQSPGQILKILKDWLANEYSAITHDSPDNQKAVKRVLSLLTESLDTIFVVDATEPDAHRPLLEKINAMPSHTIAPFSFVPVTVEVSLIKKIVKSILEAKEGLQADILQRQSVLLYTLKDVLKEYLITLPSSGVLNERLEKLKAYVAEKEVPGLDLNEALRLIETMRDQLEITSDTDDAIVFLSQKLESPEITQQAYLGDESVLATGLIQNHKELSLNRSFFDLIEELNAILNPPIQQSVASASVARKPSFFLQPQVSGTGEDESTSNDKAMSIK